MRRAEGSGAGAGGGAADAVGLLGVGVGGAAQTAASSPRGGGGRFVGARSEAAPRGRRVDIAIEKVVELRDGFLGGGVSGRSGGDRFWEWVGGGCGAGVRETSR